MDVKCPFCAQSVKVPEGSSASAEIECPACHAGFDVTTAQVFSEESDVQSRSVTPGESDIDEPGDGVAGFDDSPVESGAGGKTEALIRDEDEPVAPSSDKKKKPSDTAAYERKEKKRVSSGKLPVGSYGFTTQNLSHADEVFLPGEPPESTINKEQKKEPKAEEPKPLIDEMEHDQVEEEKPEESASVTSQSSGGPDTGDNGIESESSAGSGVRNLPPADDVFSIGDSGLKPPLGAPTDEDLDPVSEAENKDQSGSFDDLLPPLDDMAGDDSKSDIVAGGSDPLDPTKSWMGSGPRGGSASYLPSAPDDARSTMKGDGGDEGRRDKASISVADFDIPDNLDLVKESGFQEGLDDASLPEPPSVSEERQGPTAEWGSLSMGKEAPGSDGGGDGLELSFDDLEVTGSIDEISEGSDTATLGTLDIDAALNEDSEPEAELGWGDEGSGEKDDAGAINETTGASAVGQGNIDGQSGLDLGLPDSWPEPGGGQASVSDDEFGDGVDMPPLLDLDQPDPDEVPGLGTGDDGPGSLDFDLDVNAGKVVPEPAEPPAITAKAPAATRARKVKTAGSGLKMTLMGVLLVVLLGVILGQTEYGYFGLNLFVPEGFDETSGNKVLPMPGQSTGIVRDTKGSFLDEITRLEDLIREDPNDKAAKADLLEILMRFRERYPEVFAGSPKMKSRMDLLEKQASIKGQKAEMVKVMELVNSDRFDEARAVLDGMVVATAQNADVLYFYGKISLGQEKYVEAQKYFELALMKNDALVAARYFLAKTCIMKGESDKGKKILETILESEPEHFASKVVLAELALERNEGEKAAKLAGEVISKAGSDAYQSELFSAHVIMAGVQETMGTEEGRIQELRAALAIRPADEKTAIIASGLIAERGEAAEALDVLEPCRARDCSSEEFLALYVRSAFSAEKVQKAGSALEDGMKKYPDSPVFSIIKGTYLLEAGRPRAASSAFEEAVKTEPGSVQANIMLARALSREGKLHEATSKLIVALEKVPDKIELLQTLAEIYKEKRDFPAAEKTLREVVLLDDKNNSAKQQLGLVVLKLDRANEASKILAFLDRKGALDREGSLGLAESYLLLQKADEAKKVLSRLYGKAESDSQVAAEYGRALTESGNLKEGEKVLRAVVSATPSNAAAHFYLGRLLYQLGRLQKASDELLRAVQLRNSETEYRLELARVLLKQKKDEHVRDAKLQLDKVIRAYSREEVSSNERDADAYMLRGRLLFKEEKYSLAMKDFETALTLEPARLDLLLGFGRTLYEMARYNDALPYLRQVLKKEKMHAEANYLVGRIMLREGKIEDAKRYLQVVVQRKPKGFPEAMRYLGLIYKDQKLKPLARKNFAAYLRAVPRNTAEAAEIRRMLDRL